MLECLNSELNEMERQRQDKKETSRLVCIDRQLDKLAAFMSSEFEMDGDKKVNAG